MNVPARANGRPSSVRTLLARSTINRLGQFELLWGLGLGLAMALSSHPVPFTVVANWYQRRRGVARAWLIGRVGWRETVPVLGLLNLGIALPLLCCRPGDVGVEP